MPNKKGRRETNGSTTMNFFVAKSSCFFCDKTVPSLKVLLVMLLVTKRRFVAKGMTSSTFSDEAISSPKKIVLLETKPKLSL